MVVKIKAENKKSVHFIIRLLVTLLLAMLFAYLIYGEIVKAFTPYLINWKWERLPLLTQAILLMSYAHYFYIEKVERTVVINVAVNLAKKYIDDKQAKFINAILDAGVLK